MFNHSTIHTRNDVVYLYPLELPFCYLHYDNFPKVTYDFYETKMGFYFYFQRPFKLSPFDIGCDSHLKGVCVHRWHEPYF